MVFAAESAVAIKSRDGRNLLLQWCAPAHLQDP